MGWVDIWNRLGADGRREATEAVWAAEPPADDDVEHVGAALRIRPVAVRKASRAQRLQWTELAARRSDEIARRCLLGLHLGPRLPMLNAFLEATGVPHQRDGSVRADAPAPPPATIREALDRLRPVYGAPTLDVMLDCMQLLGLPLWARLHEARAAPPAEAPPAEAAPPTGTPPPTAAASPPGSTTPAPPADAARPATATSTAPSAPTADRPPAPATDDPAAEARTFTTLDAIVLRAVVEATTSGDDLEAIRVRDLVEEVIQLRPDRHRSYFHLGFLDALQGKPVDPRFPETNPMRRGWYLSGALHAFHRRADAAAIAKLYDDHREDVVRLTSGAHPEGPRAAPLVFDALRRSGRRPEAVGALGVACVRDVGLDFLRDLLDEAVHLLRAQRPEEAAPLLDLVEAGLLGAAERGLDVASMQAEVLRRRAHVLRRRGDLDGARALLERLLEGADEAHASRIHADLGLVTCRYRELVEIALPPAERDLPAIAAALRPGRAHFEASAREARRAGGHGEYCLGVLTIAEGRTDAAIPHLERAAAAMAEAPDVYRPLGLLPRAEAYLALALAESLEPSAAARAAELLASALASSPREVPGFVVRRVLVGLGTTAAERAVALVARFPDQVRGAELDALRGDGLMRDSAVLRTALLARARDERRPRDQRWADAEALVAAARAAGDTACGQEALDLLEELADDRASAERLVARLQDRAFYDPFWDEEEAGWARVRLFELAGRTASAAQQLVALGHRLVTTSSPERARHEGAAILERIRGYGAPCPDPSFERRIEALTASLPAPAPGDVRSVRARILFVGGNETQARYDDAVRRDLAERLPHVSVDFQHTGWSSNWGRQMAALAQRIGEADAVVIMRFVRTLLGAHLRRTCSEKGKRWVACTGHGRDSLVRSIEEAVRTRR
ncbi:MAG: hypothetical protein JNM10_02025 [Planctomycetia bacterium]|nr:hypothetical protein [Planctomycetia bacterium]